MTLREYLIKLLTKKNEEKSLPTTFDLANGRFMIQGARLIMPSDNRQSYIENGYNINDIIYSVINIILDKTRLPTWSLFKVVDEKSLSQYNAMMRTKDISTKDYKKALWLKDQALSPIVNTNLQQDKLKQLLKYPNEEFTFEELVAYADLYKLVVGEDYLLADILTGGANGGLPNTIDVMPAHLMTILINDTFPSRAAGYRLLNWNLGYSKEQILHQKYANPNWNINGAQLYGFSPLRSFLRNTTRNNYAKEAAISKFQNGGMEELIFVNDTRFTAEEGKAQAEAIKAKLLSQENRGSAVQGRVAVSGIPMGSVPLGRDPVQLGIIDSERWDAVMFCNGYGVPSELLGLTNKTFNNIKEGEKALTLRSAIPLLTSRRNSLNRKFQSDWGFKGQNVYVDYQTECFPELVNDQNTTAQWLESLILITPDEQREYLGVDSLNTTESQEVWVKTSSGYVPLSDYQATATDQQLQDLVNATMAQPANGQNNNANGQQNGAANGKPKPATAAAN